MSDADAEEFDRRQALIRSLTPRAKRSGGRPRPEPVAPLVWWRVKLSYAGGSVKMERDISMRSEDARDVASYVARQYSEASCVGIRRMKRAPFRR